MKNNLFEGKEEMSPEDKIYALEGLAYGTENMQYQRPLTESELTVIKDELCQALIKKGVKEEELEKIKEEFKNIFKPLDRQIKATITQIKNRSVTEEGIVYLVDDQDTKMMYYYDVNGILLSSRRLLPEEKAKQLNIHSKIAVNG
jgi:hypothetical protein